MPVETCPHCRRAMPGTIEVDLGNNTVRRGSMVVKLTPQRAEFLYALWRAKGETLPYETLGVAMWGVDGAGWPESHKVAIRIYASRLRIALKDMGVRIRAVQGIGFRLDVGDYVGT